VANSALATYLNNHLAGSVIALELLEQLMTEAGAVEVPVLATLNADITAARQELEALMAELGITQSRPQQASAWLTEKLSELKLRLDDPHGEALWRLEALEALALGLAGQLALWHSLESAAETASELGGRTYAQLIRRVEEQYDVVENLRRNAAREAFGRRA
jgi:hypothetical protein